MDSESSKDAPGGGRGTRKVKFAPRAPPRRVKKEEVKSEVVEDTDANVAKDLLRRLNEGRARHKVEKKVSGSQIAFGDGATSSIKSYKYPRGGSSASHDQNSEFNGVKQKEYKEPWDYYSEYPVTLPLRRPYSGNPEYLDEEEFGEAAESRTYDEDSANSAVELGLLEENPETSMFLMRLPTLPIPKQSATAGGKDDNGNTKRPEGSKDEKKKKPENKLKNLPAGYMGKMVVYKSGAVKLKLGDTLYDVSSGMNCAFAQDLVTMNTATKDCCAVGEISKCATITPNVDSLLDSLAGL